MMLGVICRSGAGPGTSSHLDLPSGSLGTMATTRGTCVFLSNKLRTVHYSFNSKSAAENYYLNERQLKNKIQLELIKFKKVRTIYVIRLSVIILKILPFKMTSVQNRKMPIQQ